VNTDLLIQQLVDGELDHSSRTKLLKHADQKPQLWREIAIAFTEQQIINEALDFDFFDGVDELTPRTQETAGSTVLKTSNDVPKPSGQKRWLWVLGLATSLLFGLILGQFLNQHNTLPVTQIRPSGISQNQGMPDSVPSDRFTENDRLAAIMERSSAPIPVEFRRQLLKAGYDVREKQKYESVSLPIGGSIEIPTRNIDITYLGISAYQ
jgi:hypothetical protein